MNIDNIKVMEELIKNYLVDQHKMIRETIMIGFPLNGNNIIASGKVEGSIQFVSCSVRIR